MGFVSLVGKKRTPISFINKILNISQMLKFDVGSFHCIRLMR